MFGRGGSDAPQKEAIQIENPTQSREAADKKAWQAAQTQNTLQAYENYLDANIKGAFRSEAKTKITALKRTALKSDDSVFSKATLDGRLQAYAAYVRDYPQGKHLAEADKGAWVATLGEGSRSAYEAYLKAFPSGKYRSSASKKLGRAVVSAPQASAPKAKDCSDCPEMAIIPAGKFRMGDLQNGGDEDELPVRSVGIAKSFSVSKYEITFAQWTSCVKDAGCRYMPSDNDWGTGRQPVINVSWNDAQQYIKWISAKTGKTYRLLSEAEWEYIARAGSSTKYFWGNDVGSSRANCSNCGSEWDEEQPAPVGSFAANKFGVYDMHGNVYEWVQDCWHSNYRNAPNTSVKRSGGDCDYRTVRGGSFDIPSKSIRSANRSKFKSGFRDVMNGLRIARTD